MNTKVNFMLGKLHLVGNTLAGIGCLGLLLALVGVVDADYFTVGASSGIRVIGTVAVTGCLLSAIGYGLTDHFEQ